MKKYLPIFALLIVFALGPSVEEAVLTSAQRAPSSPGTTQAKLPSVLLVERDVPQTRVGFEPVVNHATLIANLSDEPIEVDIESPIPKGLYVVKRFYPVFGYEALLAVPMYFPQEVKISDYKILERPSIEKKNDEITFRWINISIPPKQAVIAQYENYFGNLSQFYTKEGLRVLELSIRTSYTVSLKEDRGKIVAFELNYELENRGKEEIENILMDVILPDIVHSMEGKPEVKLFEVTETSASPQVKIDRGMLGDGFGKAATGTIFTISIPRIKPGENHKLSMKVKVKREAERGESYPLFTLQCRMKGNRIWPPTVLKSKKELEITKFYYRQCNLVLPDGKLFRLEPDRIEVVQVKGLLK